MSYVLRIVATRVTTEILMQKLHSTLQTRSWGGVTSRKLSFSEKVNFGIRNERSASFSFTQGYSSRLLALRAENSSEGSPYVSNTPSEVEIEKVGTNSRRISAKIFVKSNAKAIWDVLTDYENLAEFIPNLAVNQLLEKRPNGALLLQVRTLSYFLFYL